MGTEKQSKIWFSLKSIIFISASLFLVACSDSKVTVTAKQEAILSDLMHNEVQTFNNNGDTGFIKLETVSAKEITKEYDDNEVKANAKYKDKKLKIEGVVDTINLDFTGDAFLTLHGYQMFNNAHASLMKKEDGANLKKGEKVALVCESPRKVLASVMLKNCQFAQEWARKQAEDFKEGVKKTIAGKASGNKDHALLAAGVLYLSEVLPDTTRCGQSIQDCMEESEAAFAKKDKQKFDAVKKVLEKRGAKFD